MNKGLAATEAWWEPLGQLDQGVHQLAEILDEDQDLRVEERQLRLALLMLHIQEHLEQWESRWQQALKHLLKVTASYAPHLFFCYQIADLPRTNNALEQSFGQVRSHERRATGRRGAFPALVVQGAVRLQAALATRLQIFTVEQLAPEDVAAWQQLRAQIDFRQEARRKQGRFRKDPATYLASLEAQLLKTSLPS